MKLMSLRIKKFDFGFTLVELLVAIAILGGLSLVGVQLLWDTLITRSKQYSIEESSDNFRLFASTLTKSIQSAATVSIPDSSTIKITGSPCRTLRFNFLAKTIEEAQKEAIGDPPVCSPPDTGFIAVTKDKLTIQSVEFSPVSVLPSSTITIKIQGFYKDTQGEYLINFETTVTPRT